MRESYRRTLLAFHDFCRQKQLRLTVQAARQFVELTALEQAPSPGRLQEWKDALNWFFRSGRETASLALKGAPPLARSELGEAAWEQALIVYLRQRGHSWRTEQTSRGWMGRFAPAWRFLLTRCKRWRGSRRCADRPAFPV